MPLISIIITVYNKAYGLRNCLDSIIPYNLDQEIIIIDDASIDESYQILNEYSLKYPFLKIVHNLFNMGPSYSRNLGVSLAHGKYVGFIDGDDYIHPLMYQELAREAINNDYPDVLSTGILILKEPREITSGDAFSGHLYDLKYNPDLIYWNSPSCCNKIFKRCNILPFKRYALWEDFAFTYTELIKARDYYAINNNRYYYLKKDHDSVSSKGFTPHQHLLSIFTIADYIGRIANEYNQNNEFIKLIQLSICLRRVKEIQNWQIDEALKNKLISSFMGLVSVKYGDWWQEDVGLLSARVDIRSIEGYDYPEKKAVSTFENRIRKLLREM